MAKKKMNDGFSEWLELRRRYVAKHGHQPKGLDKEGVRKALGYHAKRDTGLRYTKGSSKSSSKRSSGSDDQPRRASERNTGGSLFGSFWDMF